MRGLEQVRWDRFVQEDGTLNAVQLTSREVLYVGRNGKAVERFTGKGIDGSYIFKPLTNPDTLGREIWVYDHLLPLLPVRFPRLVAQAGHRDPDRYWAIYEDLGRLTHGWDWETLLRAAGSIPLWHELPPELIPASFQGHSPSEDIVRQQVSEAKPDWSLEHTLTGLGWTSERVRLARLLLDSEIPGFGLEQETVISHGDFHPMNLSLLEDGKLAVLDWEYAHRNSVFWDLYNLLDITSPRYRKPVIPPSLRNEVLRAYLKRREELGTVLSPIPFCKAYYRYALLHSLWILLLIEKDFMNSGPDSTGLKEQQRETLQICTDILNELA